MFWNIRPKEKRMTWDEFQNINWNTNYGDSTMTDAEMKESTYFKCINRISSDVAKVPLELKQSTKDGEIQANKHYLYNLIQRPNPFMSAIDFFRAIEAVRQHKGESGSLIQRDYKGNVVALYPINITRFVIDNIGLAKTTMKNPILVYYTCGANAREYNCLYQDILHFKGFTLDGMLSTSVKNNLADTITTNQSAQTYQKDLFSNGLTNKAVVQLMSDIQDEKDLKKVQDKFNRLYSNTGRIFTVPAGYQITPLNLNLADSQFAELKKMGQIDICTSFGLQPWQIGIWDGVNNNSLEQSNLSYLNNVLLLLFVSIEAECNWKLLSENDRKKGYYFKFNEKVLLRTDAKTQADVLTQYIQSSVYTPNDARTELGKTRLPDGDDLLASSGTLKIKDLYNTAKNNVTDTTTKGGGQNNGQ